MTFPLFNQIYRAVTGVRTLDKGNYVVRQGDPIHYLCLLMEGPV